MASNLDPLRPLRPIPEQAFTPGGSEAPPSGSLPLAYDVYRQGHELVIEFDAPGVAPSDLEVAVEDRSLVVTLRRHLARGPEVDVIEAGRQHGEFRQRLLLGERWDLDGLSAEVRHGVLVVRAPLAPGPLRRRVTVAGAAQPPWSDEEEPAIAVASVA